MADSASSPVADGLRFLAFYLPQYHPIPENDEWWGKGFTEWTNVGRARPLFRGHYQPHLPAELGYYDLRLAEVREAQAALAARFGIDGFCYYHYWFGGRRLLERPFSEVLGSGRPDFPFCLCWANENWTRVWDGGSHQILMSQEYSPADDYAHAEELAAAFADSRYIKIDGRPVFLVYRAWALPDPSGTASRFREVAGSHHLPEPYLCAVESYSEPRRDPSEIGFDAAVEFHPDPELGSALTRPGLPTRAYRRLFDRGHPARSGHEIRPYDAAVKAALARPQPGYKRFRSVMPSWDNSPRRAREGTIYVGSTPDRYGQWVRGIAKTFQPFSPEENLVFVNAWNEWAEGNHLEPDQKWGTAYLEANLRARVSSLESRGHSEPATGAPAERSV
ncbi:MAG TPA: glycoside hydrolase family 99-like domain-containing protein [Candidatus Dormibacteraeota bacterium]